MKKRLITFTIAILSLVVAGSLNAQSTNNTMQGFPAEYERTQQIIEQAQNIISQSASNKGSELLKFAKELQNKAKEMGNQRRNHLAMELTLQAREKARAAILVNQQSEQNQNLVQRQLKKTDDLISGVRSRTANQASESMLRIFDAARDNQRRAWEFYDNGEYRLALRLSHQAEKIIRKLIDQVQSGQSNQQRLKIQIQQFERKMEQVRELVSGCNSERAKKFMRKSKDSFDESKKFARNGQFKRAENRLKAAKKMLKQAESACSDTAALEKHIARLENRLQRLLGVEDTDSDGNINRLLSSARNHLKNAEKFCSNGDLENCAASIKAAQMNIRKAEKMMGI